MAETDAPSVGYGHVLYDYEHSFLALQEQTTQGVQTYKKKKKKWKLEQHFSEWPHGEAKL